MSNSEYTLVQEKTFDVIQSAVNKMVDFIRPTYGPAGNKVIIDKNLYKMVVDDGVQIARDFELPDPAENSVVRVIRETAIKTNDRVGDGTTSSLIMLQAIINETVRLGHKNGRVIEKELRKGFEEAKEALLKSARKIKTKEELEKVAMVSYDDVNISGMIADLYFKLGADATITIDKSNSMETTVETAQGLTINRGYISPYMIINPERMESSLEKPYILITDYRLTEANDLVPIMSEMAKNNIHELVVVCENMEQSALATAVVNKLQGKFFVLAVTAPFDGNERKVFLEDLALLTGARMFTESKGDKLSEAKISDLGRATRFVSRRSESVMIGGKGKKADITKAIQDLKLAVTMESEIKQKAMLQKRLNTLTNTVAVIKVGAPTENEQRAQKYKVEDAVNAVKAAYKNGVVCGAGLALSRLKTSSLILNKALKYPANQLRENMGLDEVELKQDEALNVVTGKIGKFMDVGVVDPVDVLIAGLESSISIASVLLTSSGIIAEHPKNVEAPVQQ